MNQNNIEIDRLLFETGSKIYIVEIEEYITQPSIKQICEVMQGEQQFFTAISHICKTIIDIDDLKKNNNLSDEEINLFSSISSFEYLIGLITQFPYIYVYLIQLFKLFFPDYNLQIENEDNTVYIEMITKDKLKQFRIDKNNYEIIIQYIEQIAQLNLQNSNEEYNPINEQAKKIAEKLKESHKKIQEAKNKNGDQYFYANLINCLRGCGNFDMEQILNMTIYQLIQTFRRYNLHEGRQMQIIYHAAGAEIKDFIDWTEQIK